MNYSEKLCEIAKSIVSPIDFRVALTFEAIIGVVAGIANAIMLGLIWRVTVFHPNLRCLLTFHSFNLGLFGTSTAGKAAYFLYVGSAVEKPCQLVTSLFNCRAQELVVIVPLLCGHLRFASNLTGTPIRYSSIPYIRPRQVHALVCVFPDTYNLYHCAGQSASTDEYLAQRSRHASLL